MIFTLGNQHFETLDEIIKASPAQNSPTLAAISCALSANADRFS